jgi:hypothetical protein
MSLRKYGLANGFINTGTLSNEILIKYMPSIILIYSALKTLEKEGNNNKYIIDISAMHKRLYFIEILKVLYTLSQDSNEAKEFINYIKKYFYSIFNNKNKDHDKNWYFYSLDPIDNNSFEQEINIKEYDGTLIKKNIKIPKTLSMSNANSSGKKRNFLYEIMIIIENYQNNDEANKLADIILSFFLPLDGNEEIIKETYTCIKTNLKNKKDYLLIHEGQIKTKEYQNIKVYMHNLYKLIEMKNIFQSDDDLIKKRDTLKEYYFKGIDNNITREILNNFTGEILKTAKMELPNFRDLEVKINNCMENLNQYIRYQYVQEYDKILKSNENITKKRELLKFYITDNTNENINNKIVDSFSEEDFKKMEKLGQSISFNDSQRTNVSCHLSNIYKLVKLEFDLKDSSLTLEEKIEKLNEHSKLSKHSKDEYPNAYKTFTQEDFNNIMYDTFTKKLFLEKGPNKISIESYISEKEMSLKKKGYLKYFLIALIVIFMFIVLYFLNKKNLMSKILKNTKKNIPNLPILKN